MKMLLTGEFPSEPFNIVVRNGNVGQTIGRILESIKPETACFSEQEGKRSALCVINVKTSSDVPFLQSLSFSTSRPLVNYAF
jgi:hypothetical protein